jgi:hypothetical protein
VTGVPRVVRWTQAVRDHPALPWGPKALGLLIATWMGGDSLKAWPSLETLMDRTGRSRRQVKRDRAALVEAGLLEVRPGGGRGRSTTYIGRGIKGRTHAPLSDRERGASGARKGRTHAPRTPPTGCEHADDAAPSGEASSSAGASRRGDPSSNGLDPEPVTEPEPAPETALSPEQIARNMRGLGDARDAMKRRPDR